MEIISKMTEEELKTRHITGVNLGVINMSFEDYLDMNIEDRPLLSFTLTGYDDEGNYIGIEEEARRLCETGTVRMYTEKEDLVPMRVRESNPDGSLIRIGMLYPDGSFVEEVQGD